MKALILAAGFGSRMKPLTDNIPKPLNPIVNIPVIEYNIRFLKYYGVTEFFINLHYGGQKIKSYLGNGKKLGISITYLEEKEILGTAGAIGSLRDFIDETFVVVNSDTIFDFDFDEMLALHRSKNALTTLGFVASNPSDSRAVVTVKNNRVVRLLNQSIDDSIHEGNAVFTGIHILEPEIFEYIPENIFVSITNDVYAPMVGRNESLFAFFISGDWWDMGTPNSFLKCNFDLLKKKNLSFFDMFEFYDLKENNDSKLLVVGENSKIPPVPINSPVVLGNDIKMENIEKCGPNLIVGNNVVLKKGALLENAIFFSGSKSENFIKAENGVIYY